MARAISGSESSRLAEKKLLERNAWAVPVLDWVIAIPIGSADLRGGSLFALAKGHAPTPASQDVGRTATKSPALSMAFPCVEASGGLIHVKVTTQKARRRPGLSNLPGKAGFSRRPWGREARFADCRHAAPETPAGRRAGGWPHRSRSRRADRCPRGTEQGHHSPRR